MKNISRMVIDRVIYRWFLRTHDVHVKRAHAELSAGVYSPGSKTLPRPNLSFWPILF